MLLSVIIAIEVAVTQGAVNNSTHTHTHGGVELGEKVKIICIPASPISYPIRRAYSVSHVQPVE